MRSIKMFFLLLLIGTGQVAFAQNSGAVLSDLQAVKIMSPSDNEMNSIIVDIHVSEALSLRRLSIRFVDPRSDTDNDVQDFSITVEDGKPMIHIKNYVVPIENNNIQLSLKVRDQITLPYRKLVVNGFDMNGAMTNELEFDLRY